MPRIIRREIAGIRIEAHPIVFPVSALLLLFFVVLTAIYPKRALLLFDTWQNWISSHFSWLYVLSMTGFLVFALYLCFSRYGSIKLGPDDQEPEFPTLTWLAMLFSAGMGIGMLFFGVAEPMWHYLSPPSGEGETMKAARGSLGLTIFHWGLHPWSLYALVALALAYFGFRRGLPLSFRSVLYPIIGNRIHGRIGDAIDIMAVLATLFGLATSLGLGAKQVNAGLFYVFGVPQGTGIQVMLIACITFLAVLSLISGLHVGIRRLSESNMMLAGGLLLFLIVAGPTVYLLESMVQNVGQYLQRLPISSFWTAAYGDEGEASWLGNWTVFYWAWWIAWSPFVGMFIARVSKGRTIREFMVGTLLVPTLVGVVWMTGFGNTGLHQEIYMELSEDPSTVESRFNYEPRPFLIQKIDSQSGLAGTADGQWLAGPDAWAVASPQWIKFEPNSEKGNYVTASGKPVQYNRGVLMSKETGKPFHPSEEDLMTGPFLSEEKRLSLGDYLTEPVLDESGEHRVDATSTAMFFMLESYPLATVTALVATLSVILFFVTSSDSASLVADIIASGGSEKPALGTRLFWGILEGTLAAVLLVAGGLKALQTGSMVIGLPFCLIVILMCISLAIGLRRDYEGRAQVVRTADRKDQGMVTSEDRSNS